MDRITGSDINWVEMGQRNWGGRGKSSGMGDFKCFREERVAMASSAASSV